MVTHNNKSRHASLILMSVFPVFLLLMLISQSAQAILLQIDPAASQIHYTNTQISICMIDPLGEVICPPPPVPSQIFSISGNIELKVIQQHLEFDYGYPDVDRTLLRLKTSDLSSGALDVGFYLGGGYDLLGLMNGETFQIQDDPCFLFVGPGSCTGWIAGTRTGSNGTWDGHTLVWNGYQASLFESFNYTITATATDVAEPGTLLLLMSALMFFSLGKWSIRAKYNRYRSGANG